MDVFDLFEAQSGMKISYDKTTIYRTGSLANTCAKFYSRRKIKWTNEPINVLGIFISNSESQMYELNIPPVIAKMHCIADLWKNRHLSLHGKKLVINTLLLSLLVYRMSVLPLLKTDDVKSIHALITKFLWSGSRAQHYL